MKKNSVDLSSVNQLTGRPKTGFTLVTNFRGRKFDMSTKARAFTLIELLVVISIIIALLFSTVLLNLIPTSLRRGRDTTRKSDLKQYQTALENYANENASLYPTASSSVNVTTLCTVSADPLYKYISQCINDKKAGANGFTYSYASDTLKWTLVSKLELNNQYWVVCSNGKSGEVASQPTITNGACPL